jgi:hypothetical protein
VSHEVASGIWLHPRAEIGILVGVTLTMGAAQEIGRQHYSTGQELGREDLAEWCRQIDAYHRDHNGWLGFGYSFAVGRDDDPGKAHIYEGRGWGAVGAHTLGHNDDLGVVFLGNDDPGVDDATPGVRRALRLLFSTRTGGVIGASTRALREVHGHRETYPTSCPGDELEGWVRAGLPVTKLEPTTRPPQPIRPPYAWYHRLLVIQWPRMHGPDVVHVQEKLGVRADGVYGPITTDAVHRWQTRHKLHADGIVGPITARSLGR